MRHFLVNFLIISALLLLVLTSLFSLADGYTDAYYLRFTTSKKSNLILGTSRAAQGLIPQVFDSILQKDFYNFSFTVAHSPYGPVYLKAIQKKLKTTEHEGVFILAVDPWSISSKSQLPDDVTNFRENKLCLGNTFLVNCKPNPEYLLKNLNGKFITLLTSKKDSSRFLNDDGWLEINVKMDSAIVKKRILRAKNDYMENLKTYKFSTARLEALKQTISFLKKSGKVYLVRLPVHNELMDIESSYMPNFDKVVQEARSLSDGYFDLTYLNSQLKYTDGNHLHQESGRLVSKTLALLIKS